MGSLNIDSLQALDPVDFENIVKVLLNRMGFNATTTKASGDGGIDLIAVNEKPIISGKYVIQCKRYAIEKDLKGVDDMTRNVKIKKIWILRYKKPFDMIAKGAISKLASPTGFEPVLPP